MGDWIWTIQVLLKRDILLITKKELFSISISKLGVSKAKTSACNTINSRPYFTYTHLQIATWEQLTHLGVQVSLLLEFPSSFSFQLKTRLYYSSSLSLILNPLLFLTWVKSPSIQVVRYEWTGIAVERGKKKK